MSAHSENSGLSELEEHLSDVEQSENEPELSYESADEDTASSPRANALKGTTIHHLLSEEENQLLDTIDELRSLGIGRLLGEEGLPQIIVCGDQSSGKSSVLEALTRVQFPTKSNVCTTFPTELRLRREAQSRFSCRIKPSASRTEEEKKDIARFHECLKEDLSAHDIPDLIAEARDWMAASDVEEDTASQKFFGDILEIEIAGPTIAPLTIVDLPGLIHYRTPMSKVNNMSLVTSLVESYMKKENSIILAVVSAHNDIANQIVLTKINKVMVGGVGRRTLGVITKPDELPPGSEKEQEYLDLVRTNPDKFHHGWHVVRNRSYHERDISFDERDSKEQEFFQNSNWVTLPRASVGLGIDCLREKLSKMLLAHITLSLPSIIERLTDDLKSSETELLKLGEPRKTVKEMEAFLSNISDRFFEYTRDALDGKYRQRGFFGDITSTEGAKRLRAQIRISHDQFAERMLEKGHNWHVVEDSQSVFTARQHPNTIPKFRFLEEIVDKLAIRERGNELSGLSNPLLVGSLFRLQSEPWEAIASEYLAEVWDTVKEFLGTLLTYLTDEKTCNQLLIHVIDPAMEERRKACEEKLKELLLPYREYEPQNIDPYFSRKLRAPRNRDVISAVLGVLKEDILMPEGKRAPLPSVDRMVEKMAENTSSSTRNRYGALETYESMQAFYENSILVFMNNVASLAAEQCLISGLPRIFSSATIRKMDEDTLTRIASESPGTISAREELERRVQTLRKGLDTIKKIQPSIRLKRTVREPSRWGFPAPNGTKATYSFGTPAPPKPDMVSTPKVSAFQLGSKSPSSTSAKTAQKPSTSIFFNLNKP